jgi:hypothetical protein
MIGAWFQAFCLTQIVEMGAYVQATADRPPRERIAIGFGASGITHPLVWWVIVPLFWQWAPTGSSESDYYIGVAVAETFAVTAEAVWLALFGLRPLHALAWSFAANASSFGIGHFCYEHLGW